MSADRTAGTCRHATGWLRFIFRGIHRIAWPCLAIVALLCLAVGIGSYPFSAPDEARHAGIVYDMWAARQYLIPRVDGFPTLDGAPLYYWISLGFLSLFGAHEWVSRLPSSIAAAALLMFFGKVFLPPGGWRPLAVLTGLFLLQPALMLAGRFASPDMLGLLLQTMALGCFLRAALCVEQGRWSAAWTAAAWISTALAGLATGPLAVFPALVAMGLWLALRRRFDVLASLCWWPGMMVVVLLLLPWLLLAETHYPGIVSAMLRKQALALVGDARHGWANLGHDFCWLVVLAGSLPLVLCWYRYRDPARQAALRTPTAGLMAVWLLLLVPLHPLVVMSPVGHAVALVVPLLYFGVLALAPTGGAPIIREARAWLAVVLPALVVGAAGMYFFVQRLSDISPLARVMSQYYNPATDKAIMLDRFDYDFNFHMRSPKLVYVATDWASEAGLGAPRWKRELSESARFVPETAARLLLTTEPAAGAAVSNSLFDRLCERRVVNLWVIGAEDAPRRYPILNELEPFIMAGKARAWYLEPGKEPVHCAKWTPRH